MKDTLKKLRDGETIEVEGIPVKYIGEVDGLSKGALYVAERNNGPKLLTVDHVNLEQRWVRPQEMAYSYDLHECVAVEAIV